MGASRYPHHGIFSFRTPFVDTRNYFLEELAKSRCRSSWNDRLTHWEKPASDSEEAQIERAASMVRNALTLSNWLTGVGVTISPQGSYFNNTNVRQTADQDLRAVHPNLRIQYARGLNEQEVDKQLGFYPTGKNFSDVIGRMRAEINFALASKFGQMKLDMTGAKAVRVLALPGSRAPVDVVSAFRLRDELVGMKILGPKQAPSFLDDLAGGLADHGADRRSLERPDGGPHHDADPCFDDRPGGGAVDGQCGGALYRPSRGPSARATSRP